MVYHHSAKFGSHRCCNSRDIMFLVCHLISQDHMIKGSSDFIGRGPLRQAISLASFAAIGTLVGDIQLMLLVTQPCKTM